MKQIIDIIILKGWQELNDKQLRYLYRLLSGPYSLPAGKKKCLFQWSGMKVIRRKGALFVVRTQKKVSPISTLQPAEAI